MSSVSGDASVAFSDLHPHDQKRLLEILLDTAEALILKRIADEGSDQHTIVAASLLKVVDQNLTDHCSQEELRKLRLLIDFADAISALRISWRELAQDAPPDQKSKWLDANASRFGVLMSKADACKTFDCPTLAEMAKGLETAVQTMAINTSKQRLDDAVEALEKIGQASGANGGSWKAQITSKTPWPELVKHAEKLISRPWAKSLSDVFKKANQDCLLAHVLFTEQQKPERSG